MKNMLKIFTLASLVTISSVSFAKSCKTDVTQMQTQISQSGSISTAGCPMDHRGYGITKIDSVKTKKGTCNAVCTYGAYVHTDCHWQAGDWGNSLACVAN